jgi:integrase
VQFLKAAYNWAMERYDIVQENPCQGVTLNKEEPRDRYVTTEEFEFVKSLAPPTSYLPLLMELSYLLRARVSEVRNLKHEDLLQQGVNLERVKGSEGEITLYSARLIKAIEDAKAYNKHAPTPISGAYLIHDKHGAKITKNGFDSAWRRLINKAKARGIEHFTFHDLKARGVTEHKDNFAGHRSANMRKVYVRKKQEIEATE